MARVALVTGGMSGLGEAVCIKLVALGYQVVTTYTHGNTRAAAWQASMKELGYDFSAYPCDIADYHLALACVTQVQKEVGPIDVLVNNAGITRDMTFKKMDKTNWDAVMRTNLDSVFNMTKPVCDANLVCRRIGKFCCRSEDWHRAWDSTILLQRCHQLSPEIPTYYC